MSEIIVNIALYSIEMLIAYMYLIIYLLKSEKQHLLY